MTRFNVILITVVLPLTVWLMLFLPFFTGQAVLSLETLTIYSHVKFFLDLLRQGQLPLWNPFILLGHSNQLSLSYFGYGNPLWLFVLLLNILGCPFYYAFLTMIMAYFMLGAYGLKRLCYELTQQHWLAHSGFLFFLFSSYSFLVFPQIHPVLIFVPGIWFFVFAIRCYRHGHSRDIIGLSLCLCVIFGTYLPFYFLTVVCLALPLWLFFLFPGRREAFCRGQALFKGRWLLVLLCLLAFLVNLWPGFQALGLTQRREVVAPMRAEGVSAADQGLAFQNYDLATDGDLSARMSLPEVFAYHGFVDYGNDGFFLVSVFAFVVLLLAMSLPVTRAGLYFAVLGLGLFLIMLGDGGHVHPFLYQRIFYFRWIRNVYFLLPSLLAVFVVFVVLQLEGLFRGTCKSRAQRIKGLLLLALGHGSLFVFLLTQEAVLTSAYLTVALSYGMLSWAMVQPDLRQRTFFWGIVSLLIILHPAEAMFHFNQKAKGTLKDIGPLAHVPAAKSVFRYSRPDPPPQTQIREIYHSLRRVHLQDAPFVLQGFPAFWTHNLYQQLDAEDLHEYARNKFIVYDRIVIVPEGQSEVASPQAGLPLSVAARVRVPGGAVVSERLQRLQMATETSQGPQSISGASAEFQVRDFQANRIDFETRFPQDRYLVYNDSAFAGWQAFVNDRRVPLYRTNGAFKGLGLPAGHNQVRLVFAPRGGVGMYAVPIIANALLLGIFLFLRERKASPSTWSSVRT